MVPPYGSTATHQLPRFHLAAYVALDVLSFCTEISNCARLDHTSQRQRHIARPSLYTMQTLGMIPWFFNVWDEFTIATPNADVEHPWLLGARVMPACRRHVGVFALHSMSCVKRLRCRRMGRQKHKRKLYHAKHQHAASHISCRVYVRVYGSSPEKTKATRTTTFSFAMNWLIIQETFNYTKCLWTYALHYWKLWDRTTRVPWIFEIGAAVYFQCLETTRGFLQEFP